MDERKIFDTPAEENPLDGSVNVEHGGVNYTIKYEDDYDPDESDPSGVKHSYRVTHIEDHDNYVVIDREKDKELWETVAMKAVEVLQLLTPTDDDSIPDYEEEPGR